MTDATPDNAGAHAHNVQYLLQTVSVVIWPEFLQESCLGVQCVLPLAHLGLATMQFCSRTAQHDSTMLQGPDGSIRRPELGASWRSTFSFMSALRALSDEDSAACAMPRAACLGPTEHVLPCLCLLAARVLLLPAIHKQHMQQQQQHCFFPEQREQQCGGSRRQPQQGRAAANRCLRQKQLGDLQPPVIPTAVARLLEELHCSPEVIFEAGRGVEFDDDDDLRLYIDSSSRSLGFAYDRYLMHLHEADAAQPLPTVADPQQVWRDDAGQLRLHLALAAALVQWAAGLSSSCSDYELNCVTACTAAKRAVEHCKKAMEAWPSGTSTQLSDVGLELLQLLCQLLPTMAWTWRQEWVSSAAMHSCASGAVMLAPDAAAASVAAAADGAAAAANAAGQACSPVGGPGGSSHAHLGSSDGSQGSSSNTTNSPAEPRIGKNAGWLTNTFAFASSAALRLAVWLQSVEYISVGPACPMEQGAAAAAAAGSPGKPQHLSHAAATLGADGCGQLCSALEDLVRVEAAARQAESRMSCQCAGQAGRAMLDYAGLLRLAVRGRCPVIILSGSCNSRPALQMFGLVCSMLKLSLILRPSSGPPRQHQQRELQQRWQHQQPQQHSQPRSAEELDLLGEACFAASVALSLCTLPTFGAQGQLPSSLDQGTQSARGQQSAEPPADAASLSGSNDGEGGHKAQTDAALQAASVARHGQGAVAVHSAHAATTSTTAGSSHCNTPTPCDAAVSTLPWLVIIGRCSLQHSQLLLSAASNLLHAPEACAALAASSTGACSSAPDTSSSSSSSSGQPAGPESKTLCRVIQGAKNVGLLVGWLEYWSNLVSNEMWPPAAQLAALGYDLEGLVQQVQPLEPSSTKVLAALEELRTGTDIEVTTWQEAGAALTVLAQQLQAVGQALTSFAIPHACNNPWCSSVDGPSEAQLVGGRSCICAGCCTARYCSKACQRQHWKHHKLVCKALAAAQEQGVRIGANPIQAT